ncbi:UPF0280 family protein [candidate division NPL-UPA2 bacterium]|nr:UPF0280 family protein [candidate division NPL-UPA2 bacterium]
MYQVRKYRSWIRDEGLLSFEVVERETGLYIRAESDLIAQASQSILKHRRVLEDYIRENSHFLHSLKPLPVSEDAPPIVMEMAQAARRTGVGPMATVAGVIAELVGKDLLRYSSEIIVENGGDIFLKTSRRRLIGIYAGSSPLTGKIALEIEPEDTPLGICCSSGRVGHSLSFGKADAVIALSGSTALADGAATAIGNVIKDGDDISRGLEMARGLDGLRGVAVIVGERMGAWGEVRMCRP